MADLWTIRYNAFKMSPGGVLEVQALDPSKAQTDFLGSYREDVVEIYKPDVGLLLTNGCVLKFTKTIHKKLLRTEVQASGFIPQTTRLAFRHHSPMPSSGYRN